MKPDLDGSKNLYGPTIAHKIAHCPVCLSYTACEPGEFKITCKFCLSKYQPKAMTCTEQNQWKDSYANKMSEADKILE